MRRTPSTTDDGVVYRDVNGNGRMDPYEDPRLPVEARVDDLVRRLSLAEKVGLIPRSVDRVRHHPEDVPGYDDPLFPFGHGLTPAFTRTRTVRAHRADDRPDSQAPG